MPLIRTILIMLATAALSTQVWAVELTLDAPGLRLENDILFHYEQPYSGAIVSYYPNRQLESSATYQAGKRHGKQERYFNDGSLSERGYYVEGRKQGIHEGWHRNGKKSFRFEFKKGQYHGVNRQWFESGALRSERHFSKGKEEGTHRIWDENGTFRSNYKVVNGRRFGLIDSEPCYTLPGEEQEAVGETSR